MDLADLAEAGQGSAVDDYRSHLDVTGLEQAQHVAIAGLAAQFASIADDEDYLSAGALALAQVQRRPQNGVIENVGLFRWSVDRLDDRAADGGAIYGRSPGTERAAQHGRAIVAAHQFHLVQRSREPFSLPREIGDLADRAAVGIERNFIVGAEGADQGGIGLIDLLNGDVRHADVEYNRHRKLKGIAGEVGQGLGLAVFVDGEVLGKQAIHAAPVGIFHHDGDLHKVDPDHQLVEIVLWAQLIPRRGACGNGPNRRHGWRRLL